MVILLSKSYTSIEFCSAPLLVNFCSMLSYESTRWNIWNQMEDFRLTVQRGFYVDDLNTSLNSSAAAKYLSTISAKRVLLTLVLMFRSGKQTMRHSQNWFMPKERNLTTWRTEKYLVFHGPKRKTFWCFYDPASCIQPAIIKLNILFHFQKSWKLDLNWEMMKYTVWISCRSVVSQLKNISTLRMPRCYCPNDESNPVVCVDLHGFSDASLAAYGPCVYLKFTMCNGEVKTSLVAAKSCVSPLKFTNNTPFGIDGKCRSCEINWSRAESFKGRNQYQRLLSGRLPKFCFHGSNPFTRNFKISSKIGWMKFGQRLHPKTGFTRKLVLRSNRP